MNTAQIIPFQFESRPVRATMIEDDPWFVAIDVCKALGLTNPSKSLAALDDDERAKLKLGRQGNTNVINESGLFTLIIRSRGATTAGTPAHRFRKWVTAEVLPTIRKHGHYQDDANKLGCLVGQTIGTDGFHMLGAVVEGKIKHLPAKAKQRCRSHLWSQVHKAFSVVSAQDIPADQLDSARNFVGSYVFEGEWIEAEKEPAPSPFQDRHVENLRTLCQTVVEAQHLWATTIQPVLQGLESPVAAEFSDRLLAAGAMSRFAFTSPGAMFPRFQ